MRRRLHLIFQTLLAVSLCMLAIPLGIATAGEATRELYIDRLADTARFAELGEPALRTSRLRGVADEMTRYNELFGIQAALLNRYGEVVASAPLALRMTPAMRASAELVISGGQLTPESAIWPWQSRPLIVGAPVVAGDELIGVALTISSTEHLRGRVFLVWISFLLVCLVALLASNAAVPWLMRWVLRPVRDLDKVARSIADGNLSSRVTLTTGPSELRGLTASFNAMSEKVEKMVENRRNFVSHASHQIRTPLTVLRLQLENVGDHLPESGKAELQSAIDEVDRLTRICHALLRFAQAEIEDPADTSVDVSELAAEAVLRWGRVAEKVDVGLSLSGVGVSARVDPDLLNQVLDALIDNAIKFSPPSGRVVVEIRARPPWAVINVVDNGCGMSREDARNALEPFWRGAGTQNVHGSGMGLAIAATLIAHSGGRLTLIPGGERGLTARVLLPIGVAGQPYV
ncbi:sensor histidine kinase [Microbispora sp. CA-135349]|uniref:sensor histidine kinase n=1 Tax=Microbispora sp. CA-135349 TaxID=3239953 RepID=UPI003D911D89